MSKSSEPTSSSFCPSELKSQRAREQTLSPVTCRGEGSKHQPTCPCYMTYIYRPLSLLLHPFLGPLPSPPFLPLSSFLPLSLPPFSFSPLNPTPPTPSPSLPPPSQSKSAPPRDGQIQEWNSFLQQKQASPHPLPTAPTLLSWLHLVAVHWWK